jgi:hypothetical protein
MYSICKFNNYLPASLPETGVVGGLEYENAAPFLLRRVFFCIETPCGRK